MARKRPENNQRERLRFLKCLPSAFQEKLHAANDNVLLSIFSVDPVDRQEVFERLCTVTLSLFSGCCCSLYYADEPNDVAVLHVCTDGKNSGKGIPFTIPMTQVPNVASWDAKTSMLRIPLRDRKKRALGLLLVRRPRSPYAVRNCGDFYCQLARYWSHKSVRALEYVRAFESYPKLRDQLRRSRNHQEILDAVLTSAAHSVRADCADFCVWDGNRHDIYVAGSFGSAPKNIGNNSKFVPDSSIVRNLLYGATKDYEIITRIANSAAYADARSALAIRWAVGGRGVGVLYFEAFQYNSFDEEDAETLRVLLEAAAHYLLDYGKVRILLNISWNVVQHSLSESEVLKSALQGLKDLGFGSAVLYLTDSEGALRCRAAIGCERLPIPPRLFVYDLDDHAVSVRAFRRGRGLVTQAALSSPEINRWGITFFQVYGEIVAEPLIAHAGPRKKKLGTIVAWNGQTVNTRQRRETLRAFVRLITEYIDLWHNQRQTSDTYYSTIELLPVCVFRKNLNHEFTFANPEFIKDLRDKNNMAPIRNLRDVIGKKDTDFYVDENAAKYTERDDLVVASGKTMFWTESNRERNVHVVKTPVRDYAGKIVGVQGAYRVHKYKSVFDNAVEGIYQSTPEGQYIEVNDAFARLHGYENAKTMRDRVTDIAKHIYVNENDRREFKTQIRKGSVSNFRYRVYRKTESGRTIIWVAENARRAIGADGEEYYEGFVRDITDRVWAERSLRIAHDLTNQVQDVLDNAQQLNDDLHDEPLMCAERILKAAKAMQLYIHAIDELDDRVLRRQPVDFCDLVTQVIKLDKYSHRVNFRSDHPSIIAFLDSDRITNAIENLIRNACLHSSRASGVQVKVAIDSTSVTPSLLLSVRNRGRIPADVLKSIHEEQRTSKQQEPGHGIGLLLVRRYIQLHGGEFNVQSAGGFVTAIVRLPIF